MIIKIEGKIGTNVKSLKGTFIDSRTILDITWIGSAEIRK